MNDLTEQLATQYQQILAPYKEFLENLDDKYSKVFLPDLFLWKFLANDRGNIPCYRTYHPAAIGDAIVESV